MSKLDEAIERYATEVSFPDVSGFEVLELLDLRSRLAEEETRLNAGQRARLEDADAAFLHNAPGFYSNVAELGDIRAMRERAGVPCSHWWWYLERLRDSLRAAA